MSAEKPKRRPRYKGRNPRHFSEKYKEHAPERYAGDIAKVIARGKTPAGTHRSVMVREIMEVLAPQAGELAVDCTLATEVMRPHSSQQSSLAAGLSVWTW